MKKLRAGIIGATGMVGQRFITLLENHPMFELTVLAASPRSAGKKYSQAVEGRWKLGDMPGYVSDMVLFDAADIDSVSSRCDFVFCAVDMKKDEIRALEEAYARSETPVVSNNSANRWTDNVPMVIPEINPSHLEVISAQRARLGTKRGFIAVKPNCSIQSYVPALTPLLDFGIDKVFVCTYQAISGAGKTFREMPEIIDNVIPYIGGEEEKSEKEPLRIWGSVKDGKIVPVTGIDISAQCIRVPVSDGHLAAVFVKFSGEKPSKEQILERWRNFGGVDLPSAPSEFLRYAEENDRPQPKLDRDAQKGMQVTLGRLREDSIFDYKFIGLSHNTLRGAAGGAVLIAELLTDKGYITSK